MAGTPAARAIIRAIPNLLTTARLVLAVAFPFVPPEWRLWVIVTAAASDATDGVLARGLGATSALGALLDGVADKTFAAIVLVTLAAEGRIEGWQAVLLLARDVTVVLIYAYVASRRAWTAFRTVAARSPGRATTVLLFAFMIGLFVWPAAVPWLLTAAGAASVIAAVDYLLVLGKALERDEEARHAGRAAKAGGAGVQNP